MVNGIETMLPMGARSRRAYQDPAALISNIS